MTTIRNPGSRYSPARLYLREKNHPGAVDVPEAADAAGTDAEDDKALLCRRCHTVITGRIHETAVNGSHLHTFFNPAGVLYEIGCFRRARGCVVHGQPTDEFSWFKGFLWQYAVCITCRDHLGWFFTSGHQTFYGLIVTKLISE